MPLLKHLAAILLVFALASCSEPADPAPSITEMLDAQVGQLLQRQPEVATYFSVPPEVTGGSVNDRLSDYSPDAEAELRALMVRFVDDIAAIDRTGLSQQDRLSLDVAASVYGNMVASAEFAYGRQYPLGFIGHVPFVANQLSAALVDVPNVMVSQQPLASIEDIRDYVSRLEDFRRSYGTLVEKLEADAAAGAVPPAVLIERTRAVIAQFIADPPRENVLFTNLVRKAGDDGLEVPDLIEQAALAVRESVYPAFENVDAKLAALIEAAPSDAGIWQQPDGAAFYATQIEAQGDSRLSADEIHQTGLDEVDRILGQMDTILREQGYEQGSVAERMAALAREDRFVYPDSDEGRADLLDYVRGLTAEILERAPDYFERVPPQQLEVKRIPVYSQDSAAGGYYDAPSLDGSRPGTYWINLRDMEAVARWTLPTLTYHEAVPGHHFQIATALSIENLPLVRKLAPFNAYVEGWALYAERLAYEMGAYDEDPFGNLGRLQDELFRAVRLVVDTGMHHKRWSREEAIDYMATTTGVPESSVRAEIERYMAWPGQALGYKLGQLKLLELRDRAMLALGEGFDIGGFHSTILENGQLPLNVLDSAVEDWISEREALIGGS